MTEERISQIRDAANAAIKAFGAEGLALAVVSEGSIVLTEGFGFSDKAANEPMTENLLFPIASTSKAFTAACAVMLSEDGKLNLDKPVNTYMPQFKLFDPIASKETTTRDMLSHRTGLPRHDLLWITMDEAADREDLVFNRLPNLKPSQPFRYLWQYQNLIYASVGVLVEKLSGKPWEQFVSERIFKPLGMDTAIFDSSTPGASYAKLYKTGDDGSNVEAFPEKTGAIGPAGSIRASVSDMSKWLLFNIEKGKVGDAQLIGPAYAEISKPNIPYQLMPFEVPGSVRVGYGLGWFIDLYKGETVVSHGGNLTGSSTLVSMIPERKDGLVILASQDSTLMPYALANAIYDIMLEKGGQDWNAFYLEQEKAMKAQPEQMKSSLLATQVKDKPLTHDVEAYVGEYEHPGYGKVTIKAENGELSCVVNSLELKFTHFHYDIFLAEIVGMPILASFQTGLKGEIASVSLQLEFTLPDLIEFKRIPKEANA
ncbi:MAG: serine hydrolase, partial [Clostridiales bacterium]|jgi:CubicO group peptidase (beta-lactamase class C family)|nr:serine hydrolase [Clostridiales bacterium]MDR2750550.1 serine hydrolase [Clostridiales bacterium]